MFGYFKASEDGILRHHYHQRVFFFFLNIFHKVCFNPVTNGSCSVNIVRTLFGIRAKIAAFQITQAINMRVRFRTWSLDIRSFVLSIFYSMHLQGSMKQRKTANCKQFIIISVHYQK